MVDCRDAFKKVESKILTMQLLPPLYKEKVKKVDCVLNLLSIIVIKKKGYDFLYVILCSGNFFQLYCSQWPLL